MDETKIKELLENNEQFERAVSTLQRQIRSNDREILRLVAEGYNEGKPAEEQVTADALTFTKSWKCGEDWDHPTDGVDDEGRPIPKSPIGYCIYDIRNDPSFDFCIFCGSPDERK